MHQTDLPKHPELVMHTFPNGFRCVLLPNDFPKNVMECNLQVNVGSINEEEHQRGIAHLVEHCVFLGTKKYPTKEELSDAYASLGMTLTFGGSNAYTDFRRTVYTFTINSSSKIEELLDLVHEITCRPIFPEKDFESERRVVLSELVMRNTIDFRRTKAMYNLVHGENLLCKRFPIGKEELIKKWDCEDVENFYKKWYHASNMVLFLVGNFDTKRALKIIEKLFGSEKKHYVPREPQIFHNFMCPSKRFQIYQNDMLHKITFTFNAKQPLRRRLTLEDFCVELMEELISNCLSSRMEQIINSYFDPPISNLTWEISDQHREGCCVNTIEFETNPRHWKEALHIAVYEIKRLCEHGITKNELSYNLAIMQAEAEQEAKRTKSQDSSDIIDDLMDAWDLDIPYMSKKQEKTLFTQASKHITLEKVNNLAKKVFSPFVKYTSTDLDVNCTLFVSAPTTHFVEKKPKSSSSNLINAKNAIKAMVNKIRLKRHFQINKKDVFAIINSVQHVKEPNEIWIPEKLISDNELKDKLLVKPSYIGDRIVDEESSVVMRQLSNGMKLNYKKTEFQPHQCSIQIVVRGGRSVEPQDQRGDIDLALNTLIQGGVKGYPPDVIQKFCSLNTIKTSVTVNSEYLMLKMKQSASKLDRALELLHLYLTCPVMQPRIFARLKINYLEEYDKYTKNIDDFAYDSFKHKLFGSDSRFVKPSKKQIASMTLEDANEILSSIFHAKNIEINVVGDFSPEQLEDSVLKYMGTVKPIREEIIPKILPVKPMRYGTHVNHEVVTIRDDDNADHSTIYIGFKTPNKCGIFNGNEKISLAQHPNPEHIDRCCTILSEILNKRLYNRVREDLGLCYTINFEFILYSHYDFGFALIEMNTFGDRAKETVKETLKVFEEREPFTMDEVKDVVNALIQRHKSRVKTNRYWINTISKLQTYQTHKTLASINKIEDHYNSITLKDIENCYEQMVASRMKDMDKIIIVVGKCIPTEPSTGM